MKDDKMTKMREDTKMIYVWTIKKEEFSPYLLNLTFLCIVCSLFTRSKKRLIIVSKVIFFKNPGFFFHNKKKENKLES